MPVHSGRLAPVLGLSLGRDRLAALRWLCRAVSPLTLPGPPLAPPPAALWPRVLALADFHLLLPELKLAIDRHALADQVPPDVAEALDALHDLNGARGGWMRDQMLDVARALAADGIDVIWLKGATELLAPGWERSGRMMNDLDLWVPDRDQQRAALARLDAFGYQPMEDDEEWETSHHYAGRAHQSWPVRIELHRSVVSRSAQALLPDAAALAGVEWMDWQGLRTGRLSAHHRVLHALVQATVMAVPALDTGRVPLMKALDVVRRLSADFDGRLTPDLARELARPDWAPAASRYLTLAHALFGLDNPLECDTAALRRLEAFTAAPRLVFARRVAAGLFSRRLFDELLRPAVFAGSIRRVARTLLAGRDAKR